MSGRGTMPERDGVVTIEEPCLGYGKFDSTARLEQESEIIRQVLLRHADDAILHFHNPNLGKNPALTLAVFRLVLQGYPVVNHCHDFPEDRPVNYALLSEMAKALNIDLQQILYPQRINCHFAVLNGCDHVRLLSLGLPTDRVHLLPNPVVLSSTQSPSETVRKEIARILGLDPRKRIVTYPVRAIRRKNLGECILLALLFHESTYFVITQPPKNPTELPAYNRWKQWCTLHGVMVKFEAGEKIQHEELIGISDFCITTSVQEGFGMAFLEPWMAGRPVVGRNLPCVTSDMKTAGIELPGLYDRLIAAGPEGPVDFGTLDQPAQELILERVLMDPEERNRLFGMNSFLRDLFQSQDHLVEKNRELIRHQYSLTLYENRLFDIYKRLSGGVGRP
jgi:glycosyltransferase involved in cell wall biosynthesis